MILPMSASEIAKEVMELPEKERLELARQILASIAAEQQTSNTVAQSIPGLEEIVIGKTRGLTEREFRDALRC
jgi:hypothetical protein